MTWFSTLSGFVARADRLVTRVLLIRVTEPRAWTFWMLVIWMSLWIIPFSDLLRVMFFMTVFCCPSVCGGRTIVPLLRPAYRPRKLRSHAGSARYAWR